MSTLLFYKCLYIKYNFAVCQHNFSHFAFDICTVLYRNCLLLCWVMVKCKPIATREVMQLHQSVVFGELGWKFIGFDVPFSGAASLKMLPVSLYANERPALT